MKVMSFNTQHCLNFIERKIDFQIMANAILQCDADIVGLQEMRNKGYDPDYENQVQILSELTGMKYHYFAQAIAFGDKNPYGNGFLSKYPILETKTIPIPNVPGTHWWDGHEPRCILKVKLAGGITVLVSHFGLFDEERQNAVQAVIANLEKEKCILMGDFNARPDDPVLNPIRARMKDTAEMFSAPRMSYPSDAPVQKIDYIFVSPDMNVLNADIPAIVASDHRPHLAEVE